MNKFTSSPEFEEKVRKAMSTPDASPEFVNRLLHEVTRSPAVVRPRFVLRPAWVIAFVLLLLFLIASAPMAVNALKKLFGYVPDVGLVENTGDLRMLVEPVAVTRDGVTLTVSQVLVYPDHVQVVYEVSGIAPENTSTSFSDPNSIDQTAFCGGMKPGDAPNTDGDARLRLPDGTIIARAFGSDKYPENLFAMKPAYEVSIPADVTELTMVLKCIPWARLGAVPENWEVPLKLQYVPAGAGLGEPVLDVTPSGTSSIHDKGITVSLQKVVAQEQGYSFYVSIVPDKKDGSLLALYPASASVIDATRQSTAAIYMHPWTPYDKIDLWELQTVSRPAYGPYRLLVEKIFAYYEAQNVSFEFDPGSNPQVGQTWALNQTLQIAGAEVKVVSAKVVQRTMQEWGFSDMVQGIEFTFEAADGQTPIQLEIMDGDQEHNSNGLVMPLNQNGEPAAQISIGLYYEKGIPASPIPVVISKETIMLTGDWQLEWSSPDQTGINLLDSARSISSTRSDEGVTASLERVVKLDDGYLFYIDMHASQAHPDLRVVAPESVAVIDATGKKIDLQRNGPQIYAARDENVWEFSTKETIAEGPLQVVIEGAKAYYNAWDMRTPPTRAMIEPYSFTFDVGSDPQPDQTWDLNVEFEMGGYQGKVIKVRAVRVDPQMLPFPELTTDATINRGYEFTIQSADPAVPWNVGISLARPQGSTDGKFVDCIGYIRGEAAPTTTQTVTCRGLFDGTLEATIQEVSVALDAIWEMDWVLPAQ